MSLEAVAAIKVPAADVKAALQTSEHSVATLEGGAVVYLGAKLTEASPQELAGRLRQLLGDLLDRHDDPRGVPVFPASYTPEATTYDALVKELGEAADWIPLAEEPADDDPMAAMAGLLGGAGVDLGALQQQMASGDPNALMESAMQLAEQLAASGKLGEVQQAVAGMMGGMDPQQMLAQSGIDLADLERQITSMDPATLERLGVSPEHMQRALEEAGGDPRAALEKLGVTGLPPRPPGDEPDGSTEG